MYVIKRIKITNERNTNLNKTINDTVRVIQNKGSKEISVPIQWIYLEKFQKLSVVFSGVGMLT